MDILNAYHEVAPAARFIGCKYTEADRVNGSFSACWEEWFAQGWFARLEALQPYGWHSAYPEGGSYIALMRGSDTQPFEYWIGLFLPPGTPVPQGMEHIDMEPWHMGVCWVKGREPDIYGKELACRERLTAAGFEAWQGPDNAWITLERYQCPRFTQADEEEQRILDIILRIQPPEGAQAQPAASVEHYCADCYQAFAGAMCPDCGKSGAPVQPDDPILIGLLPAKFRNAMQIAFSATEIPFTALTTLGSGFTLAAGDIFETYKIYAPYERAAEAAAAMEDVLGHPPEKPEP